MIKLSGCTDSGLGFSRHEMSRVLARVKAWKIRCRLVLHSDAAG